MVAKVTEDSEASIAKPQAVASSEAGPQAPVEEVATAKVSFELGSAPTPPSNAQVLVLGRLLTYLNGLLQYNRNSHYCYWTNHTLVSSLMKVEVTSLRV